MRKAIHCLVLFALLAGSGCAGQGAGSATGPSPAAHKIKSEAAGQKPAQMQRQPEAQAPAPVPPVRAPAPVPPVRTPAFMPNRLLIPSVRLDAPVEPVGVLPNGQMGVPKSTATVGILANGVVPGQKGNALIAGHVDSYTGPAVFYPLKKLKAGDPVLISNENNEFLIFKVVAVESYRTADAPLDKIFGDTDEARLNLITCTGKYNRQKREHEKRLVIYTRLAD